MQYSLLFLPWNFNLGIFNYYFNILSAFLLKIWKNLMIIPVRTVLLQKYRKWTIWNSLRFIEYWRSKKPSVSKMKTLLVSCNSLIQNSPWGVCQTTPPLPRGWVLKQGSLLSFWGWRVNNFDIKQKMAWNICFIIYHQHQQSQNGWMLIRYSKFQTTQLSSWKKIQLQYIQPTTHTGKTILNYLILIFKILKY